MVYYLAIMDEAIKAELNKLKEIIINSVPVKQIFLFGSHANGTAQKDSDLDLYVVLKDEAQMREIDAAIFIREAICEHQSMPLDLLVMKNHRYMERSIAPTLERKVVREGILIYGV